MRAANIAARMLPSLTLVAEDQRRTILEPRGLWIIGANGRLDLASGVTRYITVDVAENFTPPKWIVMPSKAMLSAGRSGEGGDLYNPEDKRLSGLAFEDLLGFVLDRRGGRGSPWARTIRYHGIRNQIARGRLQSDSIDLVAVVVDFYEIQGALKG